MNVPKQRGIKLPISAKTAKSTARLPVKLGESSTAGQKAPICGICRARDSRYTCPRCMVLYCSLDCFKSEQHAQCSEPFYRTAIQAEVATDSRASNDEKLKMLQLLKRFEGSADDMPDVADLDLDEDDEDIDAELLEKLGDIDLDEIDTNELFHLLPPQHRDRFIQLLKDPHSQEAKELLETLDDVEGSASNSSPWWQSEGDDNDVDAVDNEKPTLISEEILQGIKPPPGIGEKLLYNTLAVCIAYAHLVLSFHLRDLASAPTAERTELRAEVLRLIPFIGDVKSTTRYESLRQAWEAVWTNVGDELETAADATTLLTLLDSLQTLSHPPLNLSEPHPITRALSDLHTVFATYKEAAPRKLAFFLKAAEGVGRERWLALEKEIGMELERLRTELEPETVEEEREALKV